MNLVNDRMEEQIQKNSLLKAHEDSAPFSMSLISMSLMLRNPELVETDEVSWCDSRCSDQDPLRAAK